MSVKAFGWVCTAAAAASWIYACGVGLTFEFARWPPGELDLVSDWVALPLQCVALLLVGTLVLGGRLPAGPQRSAWCCVLGFTACSPIAAYVWNNFRDDTGSAYFTFADALYIGDYWILTAAFAFFFLWAGGSFRLTRVWLDATTMTVVPLVGLWSFFVGPSAPEGAGGGISFTATLAYSLTLTCMMTMAALLCLQMPTFRGRISILLLVGAALADVIWEIMWMASWLTNRDVVGPFYNFGDVLCFAAVVSAVAATQFSARHGDSSENPERRAESFLPALAVLVAIALVAGSLATSRRWDAWVMVGLIALCAMLLIKRQQSERKELRAIGRQLAKREADERLTELVRRSADLIMVIDTNLLVSFASPATEPMLGIPAAQVQSTSAHDLFGPDYSPMLAHFFDRVRNFSATPLVFELQVQRMGAGLRVFKLSAVNQLANQLINGIVLTLTDVTEQRLLEREVLDVSSRERVRLSADIHDGLGQELVGISMLLHCAAAAPDPDPAVQKSHLQAIVAQVNRSVGTARDLARGLSPLHVVRGSLAGALRRLVSEPNTSVLVKLDVDSAFDERVIDDLYADHLYRIAHEAVSNAVRHSACERIDIVLRRTDRAIVLAITDDGRGFAQLAPDYQGLGLRLMEYRARVVGGALRIDHARNVGTRIEVTMPLHRSVASPTTLSEVSLKR